MRCVARAFALTVAVCVAGHAAGEGASAGPGNAPRHFQSRIWTDEDGAPRSSGHLAQTPDGYLWIASQDGLFRFDGVAFEEIHPPAGSPMEGAAAQSALVTGKGELWVSYNRSAGVAVYRGGRLVDTHLPNPPAVITNLVEGADGAIWAEWGGLSRRLWRYGKGGWRQMDAALHLPDGYTLGMVGTPDGSLWVPVQRPDQGTSGMAWLPPGGRQFVWLGGAYGMPRLTVGRDGALWLADKGEVQLFRDAHQRVPTTAVAYHLPLDLAMSRLTADRWGALWGATRRGDLFRIVSAETPGANPSQQIEIFDKIDWTTKIGASLLADSDGAIWLGREGQLERFRFANISMDPLVGGDLTRGIKLTATQDGIVYALANQTLYQVRPGEEARALGGVPDPMALCGARQGGVWVLDETRMMLVHPDGSRVPFDKVPTLAARCAEDGWSRVWLRGLDGSNWWRDSAGWHALRGYDAPGGTGIMMGMTAGPNGEVALASETPGMTVVSGNRLLHYDFRRVGMDEITSISPGLKGFYVAGRRGLLEVRDGKVRKLDAATYPWLAKVTGAVQTSRGETWFRCIDSILRVSSAELERAFAHPGAPIGITLFDKRDGLQGRSQPYGFPTRLIVSGGDGRIWAITAKGLAMVDPSRMVEPSGPPKVTIRSIESRAGVVRDPGRLVLPPGTTSVRFVFSAMGLADPERVQVRYRLVGLETDWTDPGMRRGTIYTNLAPGSYRFEVIAANAAGVWTRSGSALDFEIRPTFLQSWPFKLLCGIAVLLLIWLAYRVRMRALGAQIQARIAERYDERERIARELHDTLLQSVQALMLRFHLAATALPEDLPARRGLGQALDQAQTVMGEARERVRGLRLHSEAEALEPAILAAARERGFVPDANLFVMTTGTPRKLDPPVACEIVRIAEEALFNIACHARATRVEISIDYREDAVQVRFRDDGVGFGPAILRAGQREGHYGLVGMRERAGKLKGDMMFDTAPCGGAEVILMVPARTAYAQARRGWWLRLFRRPSGPVGLA